MGIVELIRKWVFFSHANIIIITTIIIIIINIIIAFIRAIAKAEFCFKTAKYCLESTVFYMENVPRFLIGTVTRTFLQAEHCGECHLRSAVSFLLNCLMGLPAIADDGKCSLSNAPGEEI